MTGKGAALRAERARLRAQKEALTARLETAGADEARTLRLELAGVREDLVDLERRLREAEPRHRITYHTTWSSADGRAWDRLQYQTWAELENAEEPEGPTDRDLMRAALQDARGAATAQQRAYLEAVEAGASPTEVARACGRNKSTLSRTLARGRANIAREAQAAYRLKRAAAQAHGGVLDLADPEAMAALLGALTERQTLYITLYYGEWMSLGEISDLLGVDRASVLRAIRRGLERLSQGLDGMAVQGLDRLEDALIAHYGEISLEELRPSPQGNKAGPRSGCRHHGAAQEMNPAPLEAGRAIFFSGGAGRLTTWLSELLDRVEADSGHPLTRNTKRGFVRRLLVALLHKLTDRIHRRLTAWK